MSDFNTKWILSLVDKISEPIRKVQEEIKGATNSSNWLQASFDSIALKAIAFQQIGQTFSQLGNDLTNAITPGINFQTSLRDLQAITGSSGEQLDLMGRNARELAKTFGGEASHGVEVYKLLLSQLGPALADTPDIMNQMAENVFHLSKTMGGDTAGAVEVLTTAMNQYGISMDDPIKAQKEMERMMNAMSAGAKEGSSELPQLKEAIQNVGGDAKRANVSFEEMVSSIQLLDKSGKKGAEGGVALRNVMSTLAQGRFLPQDVQDELRSAGVSIERLTDKSLSFSDRLRELKKVQYDSALITKLFGKENQLAGAALIDGTDEIDSMKVAITGTGTTMEQSKVVMNSYAESMARMSAWFKDFGISIFNATEGFLPFIQGGIQGIQVLSQIGGAIEGMKLVAQSMKTILSGLGNAFMSVGRFALSFGKAIAIAGFQALKTSASFVVTALTGIGSYVAGLVAATAAQLGLNIAMTANPIGLIVIGIAAAVGAIVLLVKYWDEIKSAISKFTSWILKNNPFSWLINIVDKIFPGFKKALVGFFDGIWKWITGWASRIWESMKKVWNDIKSLFGFGSKDKAIITVKGDGTAKSDKAKTGMSDADKTAKAQAAGYSSWAEYQASGWKWNKNTDLGLSTNFAPTTPASTNSPSSRGSASTSGSGGGGKSLTMNLNITNNFSLSDNLDKKIEEIKEKVIQMFVDSGRDALVSLG